MNHKSLMEAVSKQVEKLEKENQELRRELQIKDAIIHKFKELLQALDFEAKPLKPQPESWWTKNKR